MDHLAILNKKQKDFLQLIIERKKTIESRWYKNKYAPWDNITENDTIYFKNSGEPVTAKATVNKVIQFENITEDIIKDIYKKYGKSIGVNGKHFHRASADKLKKRYCILIFLKNVIPIPPFNINKKGFGNMSAWITIDNIQKIANKA